MSACIMRNDHNKRSPDAIRELVAKAPRIASGLQVKSHTLVERSKRPH